MRGNTLKKSGFLIIYIVMVLSLFCGACSTGSKVYTVQRNGQSFTIDTENSTISDGTNTYEYILNGNSSAYKLEITYPDGSTWWHSTQSGGGAGGWSQDYDEKRYVSGDTLHDIIKENVLVQSSPKKVLLIISLCVVGIFNTAFPRAAWYLEYGWRYKSSEPSDLALVLNRLVGIAALIAAIVIIFI